MKKSFFFSSLFKPLTLLILKSNFSHKIKQNSFLKNLDNSYLKNKLNYFKFVYYKLILSSRKNPI